MERSYPHQSGTTVPVKILGTCSVLLLAAIVYNSFGSVREAREIRLPSLPPCTH